MVARRARLTQQRENAGRVLDLLLSTVSAPSPSSAAARLHLVGQRASATVLPFTSQPSIPAAAHDHLSPPLAPSRAWGYAITSHSGIPLRHDSDNALRLRFRNRARRTAPPLFGRTHAHARTHARTLAHTHTYIHKAVCQPRRAPRNARVIEQQQRNDLARRRSDGASVQPVGGPAQTADCRLPAQDAWDPRIDQRRSRKGQPAISAVAPRTHTAPARGAPIRRPSPARLPSAACQAHARPATRRPANRREAATRSVAFPSDRAPRWPLALAGLIPDPRLPLLAGAARHDGLRVAGHDRRSSAHTRHTATRAREQNRACPLLSFCPHAPPRARDPAPLQLRSDTRLI
ncbi:hypothetical protein HETIRDRAFT_460695 [Heterobasidion irregulare TC 32-1]|uniref:Uncharacterized protein n=1 Tax=Heterobasidion irregulare (strain TC 32-1) TaxID=747525 RepID=W4JVS9_HETIT|nr:uncharacterized protein HETIRDRAFT_460695 [Heterobasidion irregulare TC 32-1]ETW77584.1 hypothetical protein HETIRDRAFT_460695 [Heterobasidion irregulare TC 32-1]